jgi:hypothetical protein
MSKLLAGATILCIVMVLLGANRGFDISDEGLYMLLADPQQQNSVGIFNYDLFFKLIFRIIGYSFSLVELRIFRLVSYCLAAWAMAGFWKNVKNETSLRVEIILVALLGLMAGYAFLPPSTSYNSLTVVFICFWLCVMSAPRLNIFNLVYTGAILACLTYVKVSVALLFFPATILILIYRRRIPLGQLTLLVLPLVLLKSIFFLSLGENAVLRLSEGISLTAQRPGYQVVLMVKSVLVGALWVGVSVLVFFGVGTVKKTNERVFLPLLIIVIISISLIGYITHITEEWNHLVLLGTAGFIGYHFGRGRVDSSHSRFWLLLLILFPFALHFGSNVYWLRIAIHYWVFWVFAFMIVFDELARSYYPVIAALTLLLVFNGIWWHPFGQDKPLWADKTPWHRFGSEVIQLDPDLVAILNRLNDGLPRNNQPVLAAYRIPGLVWLSGRQMPHTPGVWDPSQLPFFFNTKPEQILYNKLYPLPSDWEYSYSGELGVYQGDSIQVLWD